MPRKSRFPLRKHGTALGKRHGDASRSSRVASWRGFSCPCVLRLYCTVLDCGKQIEMVGNPEREIKRFAARLRRQYSEEINRDAKAFKNRVCGLFRRHPPPFAGRPSEDSITRAAGLQRQKRACKEIYPLSRCRCALGSHSSPYRRLLARSSPVRSGLPIAD